MKNWSQMSGGGLIPGQTARLSIGHKITSTLIAYACPTWEFICSIYSFNEIAITAKQGSPHHCQIAYDISNSVQNKLQGL
jgi:hypothetical protein